MIHGLASTGIVFAFMSSLCWATMDVVSKVLIARTGYFRLLFYYTLLGSMVLTVYALVFVQVPSISLHAILLAAVVGILVNAIGSIMYMKGIEKGDVSLVSPVSSSWGVVTTLLALLFLNETLTLGQGLSEVLIFVGIVFAVTSWGKLKNVGKKRLVLGGGESLVAIVFWGVGFYLMKFAVNELGFVWSLVIGRFFATLFLLLYGRGNGETIRVSGKPMWAILFILGVIEVLAFVAYNLAISSEFVSISAPIASAYPMITLVLAYVFLRERLDKNQYLGIGMMLVGLVSISVI